MPFIYYTVNHVQSHFVHRCTRCRKPVSWFAEGNKKIKLVFCFNMLKLFDSVVRLTCFHSFHFIFRLRMNGSNIIKCLMANQKTNLPLMEKLKIGLVEVVSWIDILCIVLKVIWVQTLFACLCVALLFENYVWFIKTKMFFFLGLCFESNSRN